ncbi:hypothetical protein Btru_033619 [Bulinus truncatus]|nr:hypothetical protein Btru_033619 [Bulinus truncatus]
METSSLTSALKQVYTIHKNIVSELKAQIDVLSVENKHLKCSSSEQCIKCTHLQEKNRKLQEHFISLIKDKESTIKLLRAQILAEGYLHSENSLLSSADKANFENRETSLSPNSDDGKNATVLKGQENFAKFNSKLRLTRENKRRNRYHEDIPEQKKKKSKLNTSDLAEKCHNSRSEKSSKVLVPETENLYGQTQGEKSLLKSDEEDLSQKLLYVPETIDLSDFSKNDVEILTHMNISKSGGITRTEINKKTGHEINFSEHEISLGIDQIIQKSKTQNNILEEEQCKNNFQNIMNNKSNSFKKKVNISDSSTAPAEKSKLFIKPNSSHIKCTSKSNRHKNLHQMTLSQVFPENRNEEIEKEKAAPFLTTDEKESIQSQSDKTIKDKTESIIPSISLQDVYSNKLESNMDKKCDRKMDVHMFGTLDMNGSLNPDVRLSEYLDTQSCEQTMIEKNISSVFDETVAPVTVSQLNKTDSNGNVRRQSSSFRKQYTLTHPSEKLQLEKDESRQLPGILDETVAPCVEPQLRKSNTIKQKSPGTETSKTTVAAWLCETKSKPEEKAHSMHDSQCKSDFSLVDSETFSYGSDEGDVTSEDICKDEDDETIAPSPQQILQGNSQLHYSIPSSFKFMPKTKQMYSAPKHMTDKCTKKRTDFDNSKDAEELGEEKFIDLDEALEEIDKNTELDQPDSNVEAEMSQQAIDPIIEGQSFMDSFDRVPKTDVPEFPHIQVVRKKSERDKLEGFGCQECLQYYKNSGLSDEAMKQKMNECSRHRAKYLPPSTPEHFWSLGFPDTAENMDQNRAQKSCNTPLKNDKNPRRRRRLEKRF